MTNKLLAIAIASLLLALQAPADATQSTTLTVRSPKVVKIKVKVGKGNQRRPIPVRLAGKINNINIMPHPTVSGPQSGAGQMPSSASQLKQRRSNLAGHRMRVVLLNTHRFSSPEIMKEIHAGFARILKGHGHTTPRTQQAQPMRRERRAHLQSRRPHVRPLRRLRLRSMIRTTPGSSQLSQLGRLLELNGLGLN